MPEAIQGVILTAVFTGVSTTPEGKKTILACSDLATYVQRFTVPFNAEMGAIELLEAALSIPSCEGITVNSAVSEHSIFIPRERIAKLLAERTVREQGKPMSRIRERIAKIIAGLNTEPRTAGTPLMPQIPAAH
jgi:hypothetical protein